jgi:predicted outer membrane protein
MKKVLTVTAISVALMLAALPFASAQEKGAPPAQAAEKVFQGQLDRVDANAKSIMVKDSTNNTMTFEYTDATQILGSEKSVQGLAGKTGTDLRVTYRDAGGKHIATKIETVEEKR